MKKKISVLIIALLATFAFQANAQAFGCNATISKISGANGVYYFIAHGSFSPTASLNWDFGDGNTGYGDTVRNQYANNGIYHVCLTVIDSSITPTCTFTVCDTNVAVTSAANHNCSATISYISGSNGVCYFIGHGSFSPHTTFNWNFGDGTYGHGDTSRHQYANNGHYRACLEVIDSGVTPVCISNVCDTNVGITSVTNNYSCNATITHTPYGLSYYGFTAVGHFSPNASFVWHFGDGTAPVTGNPRGHNFAHNGTFIDTLTVTDSSNHCTYTAYDTVTINYTACNFTITATAGAHGNYSFSINGPHSPTARLNWTFGDSHQNNVDTAPTHLYANNGRYNVCLYLSDSANNCQATVCDSINVTNAGTGTSCYVHIYSSHRDSLYTVAAYASRGHGHVTYQWSLPDSSTSALPNPTYVINAVGSYRFCVTVTDTTGCSASACVTIYDSLRTPPPPPACQAYFVIRPDSNSTTYGRYRCYTFNTGANLTYLWHFGDGDSSTARLPIHTYATPGRYVVCLTISNGAGCNSTFCDSSFYAYKTDGGPMSELDVADGSTGIQTVATGTAIAIYPNPANSELTINAAGNAVDLVRVFNINGQKVAETTAPANNKITVSELTNGIYFIEATVKGSLLRAKFVKE